METDDEEVNRDERSKTVNVGCPAASRDQNSDPKTKRDKGRCGRAANAFACRANVWGFDSLRRRPE